MTQAEALEVIIAALPHPGHIKELDLSEEGAVRFQWRGDKFRVSALSSGFSCEEVQGGMLATTNMAILMSALLVRTHWDRQLSVTIAAADGAL